LGGHASGDDLIASRPHLEQPPLEQPPFHGVVGGSRFSAQLRRDIRTQQRSSTSAVVLFGEPGSHKDKCGALCRVGTRR
jgi:transcriptional regulator with AAA-type ATPase domain